MSAPAVRHPGEFRWETRLLAIVCAVLVVLGVAMTYSAALALPNAAGELAGLEYNYRQLSGALIGGILFLVLSRADYHFWRRLAWPLLLVTIGLLLVPLLAKVIPALAAVAPLRNNAHRWIDAGPVSFQPSEVARFTLVLWCAMLAAKKGDQIRQFRNGLLPFLVVVGLVTLLILPEPSLSMATLVALLGGVVLFAAGAKIGYFLLGGIAGVVLIVHQIRSTPWRSARLQVFFDPCADAAGTGFQACQSLTTVGSGGITGVGLGQGHANRGFLPEADTDYIFAAYGEAFGFVGVVVLLLLFGIFCWLGFRIARTAPDAFGQYLATGITASVGISALLHMAVSLGLMPTTGLTLPFISVGRSSLIIALASTGILLSVGRMRGKPARAAA